MTLDIRKINSDDSARIFVFGDIHGVVDEPKRLIEFLEEKEELSSKDHLIFLGDYIDRGKDSKGVIDLMLELKSEYPKTIFLKGNHEDMLLDFVGFGGRLGHAFLYNGGLDTLQSYGASVFSTAEQMISSMPKSHVEFFKNLEQIIEIDDFICVHAGLNPLKDIKKQSDDDLFWIRDEFISSEHDFKKVVVFGHTPHQEMLIHLPYKLGIDTGLVFGNKLTCLELKSGDTFQIFRGEKKINKSNVDLSNLKK